MAFVQIDLSPCRIAEQTGPPGTTSLRFLHFLAVHLAVQKCIPTNVYKGSCTLAVRLPPEGAKAAKAVCLPFR
jgi:hypothetical protein